MRAACQPALSGAISKTGNLPESATVEDSESIYMEGWKLGLKALAVYRDNCKVGQPLSDARKKPETAAAAATTTPHEVRPVRRRLPKARPATVTRFSVAGAEGYMTASSYPETAAAAAATTPHEVRPVRRRLPKARPATVTRFSVAGAEGYMTASSYPD